MASHLPIAKVVSEAPGIRTVWLVSWPSTLTKQGKSYQAITYPDSDLISMQTAAKQRPVSSVVGRSILQQIREAIDRAKAEDVVSSNG